MVHFDAIAREMWFGDCWGRAEHSTAGRRRTDEDGEEAWNGYVAHLAQHRLTTAMLLSTGNLRQPQARACR